MHSPPELLAPAGDMESLAAAVRYGADAVYVGGNSFGMRAAAANFDAPALRRAAAVCHGAGVRLYLTCNTIPVGAEVERLPEFIADAAAVGVDGLIVADVGVMALARRIAPQLELHVSTQMGVTNPLAAAELLRLGASRAVLARELSLGEIAYIRANTPPELKLEAFVHGAMCMSVSGRCLISNYMTGRDGNRGRCAQPCRWRYALVEETRPGRYFPIGEDERGSYLLNAQDLRMIEHLDKIIAAGVDSLKIEGRAKSAYYVAAVTGAYRHALDWFAQHPGEALPGWILEETDKISHRPYSTGFYLPESPPSQSYDKSYRRAWQLVAAVDACENGELLCTGRNRFSAGEALELLMPRRRPAAFTPPALYDEEGNSIGTARHPMMRLRIPCGLDVPPGSMLRRRQAEEE